MSRKNEEHPTRSADELSGAPRWVKILVAAVVVVVLALVISKLAGVEHGPGMHGHVPPVQHAP